MKKKIFDVLTRNDIKIAMANHLTALQHRIAMSGNATVVKIRLLVEIKEQQLIKFKRWNR